jgi:DNA invertase Pin-like site-specific DNA recombinase
LIQKNHVNTTRAGSLRPPRLGAVGDTQMSTDGQAESRAGLAVPRCTTRDECARRLLSLTHFYEDAAALPKSLDECPALAEAFDALAMGEAAVLVVDKLDRLARSVRDFAELVRRSARAGQSWHATSGTT